MRMDQLLLDMQSYYKNMTTVLITHDMSSVKRVADYILLVKDGIAHFNGTKEDFFTSSDAYIKNFLEQQEKHEQKHTLPDNPEVRKALAAWLQS
jgi:phospholipid/cholesterol/gamma-HCH transport system ATP-binding protein